MEFSHVSKKVWFLSWGWPGVRGSACNGRGRVSRVARWLGPVIIQALPCLNCLASSPTTTTRSNAAPAFYNAHGRRVERSPLPTPPSLPCVAPLRPQRRHASPCSPLGARTRPVRSRQHESVPPSEARFKQGLSHAARSDLQHSRRVRTDHPGLSAPAHTTIPPDGQCRATIPPDGQCSPHCSTPSASRSHSRVASPATRASG